MFICGQQEGGLENIFVVIALFKEKPGDSKSYLLAQLEHKWGQGVHRGRAQFRCAVKCPNNWVDNAWRIICKVQGLCEAVQCLQGNPTPQTIKKVSTKNLLKQKQVRCVLNPININHACMVLTCGLAEAHLEHQTVWQSEEATSASSRLSWHQTAVWH